MKISLICFSLNGRETGEKLKTVLESRGVEVEFAKKSKYIADYTEESTDVWTARQFLEADGIIFIGACGIAVRHIAPYIKSKTKDPAVVCVDECGKFAISLLSGHLGGANELTCEIAEILGAVPVVTTATDLHQCFAVDVFARKNKCVIRNMPAAREVSAALLAGKQVGFYSEFSWEGELPKGLVLCDEDGRMVGSRFCDEESSVQDEQKKTEVGIAVSIHKNCKPFASTTTIIPPVVILGMGCRRGKESEGILNAAKEMLVRNNLYREAIAKIVSIDLKKDEQGLKNLAALWQIPFETYSQEDLMKVEGDFTASAFVKSITGADNVCERSAVLGSEYGKIIQKKTGSDGVTTAAAIKDWRIRFE